MSLPTSMDKPVGVVLAGGLARRMGGGDKTLRTLAGEPLLGHVLRRVRPQVSALALSANGDPDRFAAFALPVLGDTVPSFAGPLAGILAALEWAANLPQPVDCLLSVPGDAPFLPEDLVLRLYAAVANAPAEIAYACSGGWRHPVVALWPLGLRLALRQALVEEGLRKIEVFTARYHTVGVEWPVGAFDPFLNLNTPEDLAEAERKLTGLVER